MKTYYIQQKNRRRKPKRRIPVLLAILLCVAALAYFSGSLPHKSSSSPPQKASPVEPEKPKPVEASEPAISHPRIGVILPLSGDFKSEGEMIRDGIGLAKSRMDADGVKVEVDIKDGGGEAAEAIRMAREFAANPDTLLVVAHLPVSVLSPLISDYERAKLPLLVVSNSHESLLNHPFIIPFIPSDHREGARAAELASKWAGKGGATVIQDTGSYGMILSSGFNEGAQKAGFSVTTLGCAASDPSIDGLIDQIIEANPAVIWLAGPPSWGAGIVRAIADRGFKGHLMVPQSYGRMIPDGLFGEYAERLTILWPVESVESDRNGMPGFKNDFLRSFMREPDCMAVLGYDIMGWIEKALQSGPPSRKGVRERLLGSGSKGQPLTGVGGSFYFDEKGRIERPFHLVVYRGGKLVPVLNGP